MCEGSCRSASVSCLERRCEDYDFQPSYQDDEEEEQPDTMDLDNLEAEKGLKGLLTYSHSNSIMEGMPMGMAKELEPKGVMVNVVYPGRVSTAMTQAVSTKSLPGAKKLFYPIMKLMFRGESRPKRPLRPFGVLLVQTWKESMASILIQTATKLRFTVLRQTQQRKRKSLML